MNLVASLFAVERKKQSMGFVLFFYSYRLFRLLQSQTSVNAVKRDNVIINCFYFFFFYSESLTVAALPATVARSLLI